MEVQNAILGLLCPAYRLNLAGLVLTGAGVSDVGHYLLDGFGLIEMLFGKGKD